MAFDGIIVWADGRLRTPDERVLTAVDHGITVGDGVFETCGVVRGQAFALTRHLARLARSAHGLGLDLPDEDAVRAAVAAVLAAGEGLGRLRITLTAGPGPLGSGRTDGVAPSLLVVAGPAAPPAAPIGVARVPWVRNERSAVAGLKTTSYAENVVCLAEAARHGATEALLANTLGELCEGTGSNVFVERAGELLTPHLSSGCLAGITRALVLEWGAAADLPVREAEPGELRYDVLDEVAAGDAHLAVCGSVRTFVPVDRLDDVPVTVGPISTRMREVYLEREVQDLDP